MCGSSSQSKNFALAIQVSLEKTDSHHKQDDESAIEKFFRLWKGPFPQFLGSGQLPSGENKHANDRKKSGKQNTDFAQ